MNIGIIDADLLNRTRHRFPNLASMKISGFHKEQGDNVKLLLKGDVKMLIPFKAYKKYDKLYISKVFTDTPIDKRLLKLPNVIYGGTGFYFDKAPDLPDEIEHHFPDYHLYDKFIEMEIKRGINPKQFKEYTDYSIGFTTRGCFRKCPFCVNQKYDRVNLHSPISEFYDESRPKICLLDDNVLGHKDAKKIFEELQSTGKKFKYKQGLDERLLNSEKINMLLNSKYDGTLTFAFDNIDDKEIIIKKMEIWRKIDTRKTPMFYVLCAFDKTDRYDAEFWKQDIIDTFERIKILMKYKCIPYIMRYERYKDSPYKGTYINLARWCNQPQFYKKKSFREFCNLVQDNSTSDSKCSTMRYMNQLETDYPEIAKEYFDVKFEDINEYK